MVSGQLWEGREDELLMSRPPGTERRPGELCSNPRYGARQYPQVSPQSFQPPGGVSGILSPCRGEDGPDRARMET